MKINYKDTEGLEREAREGAAWGFTGKQIIHPSQAAIVQDAFTPSDAAITRAKRVVDAHVMNAEHGSGAFSLDGMMIDMPTVLQAHNVLTLAAAAGKIDPASIPAIHKAK